MMCADKLTKIIIYTIRRLKSYTFSSEACLSGETYLRSQLFRTRRYSESQIGLNESLSFEQT